LLLMRGDVPSLVFLRPGIPMQHCGDNAIPGSYCSKCLAQLWRRKQARTSLCLCSLSIMWFKAILWRLLFMVLLLALVCVATPASSGWPKSLDEDVNTPALEWLEVLELAAVVCKYPTACSCVRSLSVRGICTPSLWPLGPVHRCLQTAAVLD